MKEVKSSFAVAGKNLSDMTVLNDSENELVSQIVNLRGQKLFLLASIDSVLPQAYEQFGYKKIINTLFSVDELAGLSEIELINFVSQPPSNGSTTQLSFSDNLFYPKFDEFHKLISNTIEQVSTADDRGKNFGIVASSLENLSKTIVELE